VWRKILKGKIKNIFSKGLEAIVEFLGLEDFDVQVKDNLISF
jgi:hypothetical protein